tara:strand:- start:343 stop:849 length:507 start_codon:yes stop_codon:yes gene_type:complete
MANISYKNTKFPLKIGSTLVITIGIALLVIALSTILLKDEKEFSSLEDFNLLAVDYEFQTILEDDVFKEIDYQTSRLEDNCQFFVQSGSFKSRQAAESQVLQLQKINYQAKVENVNSANNFNYIVVVGPFKNRSQTNNAREDFRRLNMDSLPPKCIKIKDELEIIQSN